MAGDGPEGITSAQLMGSGAMSDSAGPPGAGLAASGNMGTATTIGSQNAIDTLAQGANLENNFGHPGYDMSLFTGGGALEGNLFDLAEGNMAPGGISVGSHDMNFVGDMSMNKSFSPGKETLNMPRYAVSISSKGQEM